MSGVVTHGPRNLRQLRPPEIVHSLRLTHDAITRATGEPPVTFRPPYGLYNTQVLANRFRYSTVLWDVDARDRESPSPALIETLRLRGYALMTVRELLRR